MAKTEVLGSHIGFYVRTYGSSSPFKRLVCEESVTFDLTNAVTSTLTKCGYFKGVSIPDFKANGSAVNNITPDSSELSLKEVHDYQIALTKLEFVVQNEAHDSVTAGQEIYMEGAGYFTAAPATAAANDVVKFTWNFEGVGVPNTTIS